MKKLLNGKKQITLLLLLLVALVVNLFYWGSRKEGYYCDELYSYHFVCQVDYPSITGGKEGNPWLNTWQSPEFFMDYLTITSEEAFDLAGTCESIRQDVHPPVYYLLLEVVCSAGSLLLPGVFSKWFGIFLNVGFFVLTIAVLYMFGIHLMGSKAWAMVVCALYGFSVGAVSTVVFIRMYMIFTFTCILFSWLNALLWEKLWMGERKGIGRLYGALFFTTILGILNHYYFFLYAFFTCALFWGCSLLLRSFRFSLEYALVMTGGIGGSYLLWPEMVQDIFTNYRGVEAFDNLRGSQDFGEALREYGDIMASGLFGGKIGAGILCMLFLLLILGRFLTVYWEIRRVKTREGMRYLVKRKAAIQRLEIHFGIGDMFWAQLIVVLVCYILLVVKIAPYRIDRYVFNVYPALVLAVAYAGKRTGSGLQRRKTAMSLIMGMMACLVLLGYWSPGVNYLFQGTKEELETAEHHSHLPVFYITSNSRYRVCGDSFYLSRAQYVYPVKEDGINGLSEALLELEEVERTQFLVYIDLSFPDRDAVLEAVRAELGTDEERLLFQTEYSAVYVME